MAFYIRKAFKTGPVRLNLSKGGLGLSAGITGARVGINSRGTYVHGGRHGLYYRKYTKQGKKSSARPGEIIRDGSSAHHSGSVSLFRDTGVTYPSKSAELRKITRKEPSLPSSKLLTATVQLVLGVSILFLFLSFIEDMERLLILALIIAVTSLGWVGWNGYWKQKAQKSLTEIAKRTEENKMLKLNEFQPNEKMSNRWHTWLNLHLHAVIGEMAMRHEEIDTLSTLRILDEQVPAKKL